jgi:hypothetical protein
MNRDASDPLDRARRNTELDRFAHELTIWAGQFDARMGPVAVAEAEGLTIDEPVPDWAQSNPQAWGKWRRRCEWLSRESGPG